MTRSSSRFQHSTISRSEFCETNWHSTKRFASKQIARRDTRVSKIKSPKSFLRERSRSNRTNLRELNEIYIEHFQVNETKVLSKEIMKHDVFMSEATKRIFTKRRSSVFASDECISLSLCASWVSENDREFALMKKSFLWERWLHSTFTWRIVSQREWSWVCENDDLSIVDLFVRRDQSTFNQ